MPKYRVQSGDLDEVVDTPYDAEPTILFVMAMANAKKTPKSLGVLAEITGGEYKRGSEIYVSCEKMLRGMGKMTPNEQVSGARSVPLDAPVGR